MRIIDADAFKESLKIGLKEFLPLYKKDQTRILAVEITKGLMKDIDEVETVASCKTCVWRADHVLKVSGRENSLCPIEQHYVLPEDGFCHLYESDKKISDEHIKGLVGGKK